MPLDHIAEELHSLAVPVESLIQDPGNLRLHDSRSIRAVQNSLARFGQRTPIVVRNGTVIAGNARLQAAVNLGWSHIAVVSADADDDNTAQLYAITDNRTADLSEFDMAGLADVLASLKDDDLQLDDLGWSDEELSEILDLTIDLDDKPTTEETIPEPPEAPTTRPGDLIQLGDHRLICGDSTDPDIVDRLFGDQGDADLIVTDPPYGISYRMDKSTSRDDGKVVLNDDLKLEDIEDLLEGFMNAAPLMPGGAFYIFSPPGEPYPYFWQGIQKAGYRPRHQLAWVKNRHVMGRADYHYQHESIIYGWDEGAAHDFIHDRTQSTVWNFDRPSKNPDHPTMKPIGLMKRCILNSSRREKIVYDGFLGSGTTLLASQEAGRRCYGVELDPAYCDVVVDRWEAHTGRQAVRP